VKNSKTPSKVVRIDAAGHQERLRARRDALVELNLDLVASIAHNVKKSLPPSFDIEDLIGVGHIALVETATRYRPELHGGAPFSAYARQRIRGAMLDSIKNRHYRENTRPSIEEVAPVVEECKLDRLIDEERNVVRIREAVEMLPPAQREAVERKFWDGKRSAGDELEAALDELRRRLRAA
jgi:RNA polymerase sigma factor (sigma-70 family)